MLQGEDGRGHEHGHLATVFHGPEGGAHGHLGLAEADVPAHQPVHGGRRSHVHGHGVDGSLLVWGGVVGEARAELVVEDVGRGEG